MMMRLHIVMIQRNVMVGWLQIVMIVVHMTAIVVVVVRRRSRTAAAAVAINGILK